MGIPPYWGAEGVGEAAVSHSSFTRPKSIHDKIYNLSLNEAWNRVVSKFTESIRS